MKWNLEELTEDAILAYLEANLEVDIQIYTAWGFTSNPKYPAAIIHAGQSEPISEDAAWHDPRSVTVEVAVITEAAPRTNPGGVVIATARERNIEARSAIMDLLAVSDLNAQLIAQEIDEVAFSMAQVTETERSTEERHLITTITILVIAEPVTGS